MATSAAQIAKTGKFGDLRRRLVFLLLALVVYRIGRISPFRASIQRSCSSCSLASRAAFSICSTCSRVERSRASQCSHWGSCRTSGIDHHAAHDLRGPDIRADEKEGEAGRRKITQYTRYGTLGLALFQSLGIAVALESSAGLVLNPGFGFRMTAVVSLTAGTLFLMWLGEQITERGLGNGISILIFGGIAAGLPSSIGGLLVSVRTGAMSILAAIFIVLVVAAVTYFVVYVERGQRKILVNYARRQVGNKVYGGQSSHLPLKLNMAGVIPPIFASSIILLPATVVNWFSAGESMRWLKDIASTLTPGQPIYVILYAAAIIFFCFFYTALVFNSRETADNLKKSGAFIPGIRPGEQTARYIDKILVRLTLAGAIYITFVCLLPEFLILKYNVPFYFGGTSLLIIVVVTMDFMAQVQNYVMSQQYESLLKKRTLRLVFDDKAAQGAACQS